MSRRPPKRFKDWSAYYRWRIERGKARGLSRAQARGHPAKSERHASKVERRVQILGRNGPVVVTVIGTRERSRAGHYDNDTRQLLKGKIAPSKFERRWGGKTIGGQSLPSWQEVLTLGHRNLAHFDDFYVGGH